MAMSPCFFFEANLSFAKAHMTPEEILEAERLAEEWKSRHAGALNRLSSNDNFSPKTWESEVEGFKPECVRQLSRIPGLLVIFIFPQTASFRPLSSRTNAHGMAA